MLITLLHLAGLKRNAESDIFNFCEFLPSVENPACFLMSKLSSLWIWNFSPFVKDIFTRRALGNSPNLNAFIAHAFRGESERQNEARVVSRASDLFLVIEVQKRVNSSEFQRCARVTFAFRARYLEISYHKTREFPWGISCSFEPRISFGSIRQTFCRKYIRNKLILTRKARNLVSKQQSMLTKMSSKAW